MFDYTKFSFLTSQTIYKGLLFISTEKKGLNVNVYAIKEEFPLLIIFRNP